MHPDVGGSNIKLNYKVTLSEHSTKGTWEKEGFSEAKCQPLFQISYPNVPEPSWCLQISAEGPVPASAGDFGCHLLAFSWVTSQLSRWPSQPSLPAPSPFAPSQAPSPLVSTKACHSYLKNVSVSWEDVPEWGDGGQKRAKIAKRTPLPHPPCHNADLLSGFKWELLFCETELTTYRRLCFPCLHLWYTSFPFLKSTDVRIQPTKRTLLFYQSHLAASSQIEDDISFDLVTASSGKYFTNTPHVGTRRHVQKSSLRCCLKDWKTINNINKYPLAEKLILKLEYVRAHTRTHTGILCNSKSELEWHVSPYIIWLSIYVIYIYI